MSGSTRRIQHLEVNLKYSDELSEDEKPEPGRLGIVVMPDRYTRVRKWHVNRVFYFLICTSALCLATVALVPKPSVQATALGIWATAAGVAQFLLAGAYRNPESKQPPGQ
jgi:hypothetical protein